MPNKYHGTFTFTTSADPAESFDKVKAMSAALGQKIELVYKPSRNATITVSKDSKKESFTAAVNKGLKSDHANDVLMFNASSSSYPDPVYQDPEKESLLDKHAQEIANKTGANVGYAIGGSFTFGFKPETKKPSAQMRPQPGM